MTQSGDDVSTRELHLLQLGGGRLVHAVLGGWSPTDQGFSRFNVVSPWSDVENVIGNVGGISSAAIVADRPNSVSVFFVAGSNGRYRLWHTVRFRTQGSWLAPRNVLQLNGFDPTDSGQVQPMSITAGVCPHFAGGGAATNTGDAVVAIWGGGLGDPDGAFIQAASTPRDWPGPTSHYGTYSPVYRAVAGSRPTGTLIMRIEVAARPFLA
jgi:hypothetical protein